ncbi:MAG: ArnT family glycosyltransferase, partial [Phototrophicaceae bacterium]
MNPSQRWTFGEWGFVVILLLMATAIRTVGLDFGHPDAELFPSYQALDLIHSNLPIHPDEYSYVQSPLKMVLTWGRNPEFYHNPAFLLSLNYVTYLVTGERSRLHWQDRATLDARQQAPFRLYFIGRVYSMLSGVVLTAAAYAVARRLFGRYAALNAGLLMAFSLSLVQHAHYSKSSSLAATFCALTLWAAFHALTAKRFRWSMLALAGVCAGFAAGNRYDAAGISIVVFLVGCVVIWRARTLRVTLQVILAWAFFPTAFILAMPWAVFDTVRFLEEVTWITGQYTQGIQEHNTPRWWSLF